MGLPQLGGRRPGPGAASPAGPTAGTRAALLRPSPHCQHSVPFRKSGVPCIYQLLEWGDVSEMRKKTCFTNYDKLAGGFPEESLWARGGGGPRRGNAPTPPAPQVLCSPQPAGRPRAPGGAADAAGGEPLSTGSRARSLQVRMPPCLKQNYSQQPSRLDFLGIQVRTSFLILAFIACFSITFITSLNCTRKCTCRLSHSPPLRAAQEELSLAMCPPTPHSTGHFWQVGLCRDG